MGSECYERSKADTGPAENRNRREDCKRRFLAYPRGVDEGYSWRDLREDGPSHLPGPDHLGWWVGVALLLAVVLHAAAFLALGQIKVALGFQEAEELRTATINLDRVEVSPEPLSEPAEAPEPQPAEETARLLDEIDILDQLPEDHELDISPEKVDPEFALERQRALPDSRAASFDTDIALDFDLDTELPELGRTAESLPPAAQGQVVIDPGTLDLEDRALDDFTEQILGKEGAEEPGTLDGVVSLDEMVGLPESVLIGKKTMLPSDLIFEYDSADLRESARVGLMKLALLIERNPGLFCWIEGHTDLFGGEDYNLDLSRRRAESVKSYLVEALRLPEKRIFTRGRGESRPVVGDGTVEEQAPNRRVEIRMRREPPPPDEDEPILVAPDRPRPLEPEPEPEPEPPKARAVDEPDEPEPSAAPEAPKAVPVEEEEDEPTDVPRAIPVEEGAPRAVPVEE
jgi:outer membrane protein OmpA-like peptidoglycan-associated protein